MKNKTRVNWICIQVALVFGIIAILALANARVMIAADSARLPRVQGAPASALIASGTVTPTASLSATATLTPTITKTITSTTTLTAISTPTITPTQTSLPSSPTATRTVTPTLQPTATKTNTLVANTATPTLQATATLTKTSTPMSNTPTPTPTTFIFVWWYPTPAWSTDPNAKDSWALNPYNLKTSYNWSVVSTFNNTSTSSLASSKMATPASPSTISVPTLTSGFTSSVPASPNPLGSFPTMIPGMEATRFAQASENPEVQATEIQPPLALDSDDQTRAESDQLDSSYYAYRLIHFVTVFGTGGLLLGSGVLSIAALYFVWRTYFRR